MIFREAAPVDAASIAALHREAFGGSIEADLVSRLTEAGLVVLSFVAEEAGDILGHVLFSTLEIEIDGHSVSAVSLAPMAVSPARQRQGIGSALLAGALDRLPAHVQAVIVLGHPEFYRRFGFSAELARKLDSPYGCDAFMALERKPGALAGGRGRVRYPAAFDAAA